MPEKKNCEVRRHLYLPPSNRFRLNAAFRLYVLILFSKLRRGQELMRQLYVRCANFSPDERRQCTLHDLVWPGQEKSSLLLCALHTTQFVETIARRHAPPPRWLTIPHISHRPSWSQKNNQINFGRHRWNQRTGRALIASPARSNGRSSDSPCSAMSSSQRNCKTGGGRFIPLCCPAVAGCGDLNTPWHVPFITQTLLRLLLRALAL